MAANKTTNLENQTPVAGNGNNDAMRRLFFVSVLNMSWQLAIVVLVPIIGGFKLDQKFGTLPALTIIGFITAMVCMAIVLRRQLKTFGPPPKDSNT